MQNFETKFNPDQKELNESGSRSEIWSSLWLFIWDFLKVFVIAVAVIVPVRFYLFQPFIVTGHSMQPNFQQGEYLIIDEISYRFSEPRRGDATVIRSPGDDSQFFIKRIIGLPGETIQISSGKVVVKNADYPSGVTLVEDYLSGNVATFGTNTTTLEKDQFFVLGDNRIASSDSRFFGPIPRKAIVGRVFLRAFPLNRFSTFSSLEYQHP